MSHLSALTLHSGFTPTCLGVKPECNVRTDKWDIAMKAMDRVNSYKLTEYLKEGTTEAPNEPDGQKERIVTGKQIGRAHV